MTIKKDYLEGKLYLSVYDGDNLLGMFPTQGKYVPEWVKVWLEENK